MAFTYQKTVNDMTVIIGPREQIVRKFDFGAWTEMRIGMFLGAVSLADNNAAGLAETVTLTSALDRFSFGIKDDSSSAPATAGSRFVGMGNVTSSFYTPGVIYTSGGGGTKARGFDGVTQMTPSPDSLFADVDFPADPSPASTYCGFIGIKFVVTDLGLATQTIEVFSSMTPSIAGTDYTAALLRFYLSTFSGSTSGGVIQWNAAGAALPVPDCWFLRNPFFNNRIRISCMDALKVAPV